MECERVDNLKYIKELKIQNIIVREEIKAFNIPYIYDYITKLCRQQARVIENHKNANVHHIGQVEA
jgi:hypothetical protein